MRIYVVHAVPSDEDGGYAVIRRPSGPHRVWFPSYRARWVSVRDLFFGSARLVGVGPSRGVLVQGLAVRVSYSRWWRFVWLALRLRRFWRRFF